MIQGAAPLSSLQYSLVVVSIYAVGLFYWPISYLATYLRRSPPAIDTLVFLTHSCAAILVWYNGWNGLMANLDGSLPVFAAWVATAAVNICMSIAGPRLRPR